MANPFDRVANDYQASKDSAANKPSTCANCGHPVNTQSPAGSDDEPLSKKIKRGLGLPDDGAAF